MKRWKRYIIAAAIFVAVFCLRVPLKQSRMRNLDGYQEAEVVRVIDGDTMVVKLDGQQVRVRLIGVDCEEIAMADEQLNTEKGRREAEFVKTLLPAGTTVYLQKDQSETDAYGRLLRYVWLELPRHPEEAQEVREKMLNGLLIEKMHTRVEDYPPDVLYSELFWEIEKSST